MSAGARDHPTIHVRQLVVLLNVAVYVSTGSQNTGTFAALKAQDGSDLCAVSTPDSKISVRSKLHCYSKCVSAGCVCKSGANYRKKEKLCEMFSAQPVEHQVLPDCAFYQVGLYRGIARNLLRGTKEGV